MLVWPAVAVLGFIALIGVVVILGLSTTARYEFDRNRVQSQRKQPAPVPGGARTGARPAGARTAGSRTGGERRSWHRGSGARAEQARRQPGTVGVAAHPAGGVPAVAGWWLVDQSGEHPGAQVVAGPFADRVEADWATLAGGLPHLARYGLRRGDGTLIPKPSPQEQAWLGELARHLDRLAEDWDGLVSDDDALTTLVVELAAALVETGLPLHDCSERGPGTAGAAGSGQAGGVCLTPDPGHRGVLVSWRQHDRMSVQRVRGAAADTAVQRTMNTAIAGVLGQLGFGVEPLPTTGCHLVTPARR